MKKNKLLVLSLATLSLIVTGCKGNNTSSATSEVSSVTSGEISNSNTTTSGNENSSSTSSNSVNNSQSAYKEISDASKLFKKYASKNEYNFEATYTCSTVSHREFKSTWSTDYQYMEGKIQLTYSADGTYYTDYYYEDASKDIYTYYVDMGGAKEYQTINGDNEYYFQFYSAIDEINVSNIEWEDNFLVDEKSKKLIPADSASLLEMGQHIFGEKANEYWEKLELSYNDGYITKIEAISIYMETVYYYTIDLSNHSWVDFELPAVTQEYVGNQPYYKNEEYVGITLTQEQKTALEFVEDPADTNYTVATLWEQVVLGEMTGLTVSTASQYADSNCYYRYTDAQTNLVYNDYIVSQGNGQFIYYQDEGGGNYKPCLSGTDDYTNALSNYALDQINLAGLKAEDFIYNQEKGYLMPKDKETEKRLNKRIFGFEDYYYGLHIYLSDDNVVSKVETSLFIEQGTSIASFKKTYTITNIGTTEIVLPREIVNNEE